MQSTAVILKGPAKPDRLTVADWEGFIHQIALYRLVKGDKADVFLKQAQYLIDEWAFADRNIKKLVVRPDDIKLMEEVTKKIQEF